MAYDGVAFVGYQRQGLKKPTVQLAVEKALAQLHGGLHLPSLSAGRTDSGVHAQAMPVHVYLPRKWELPRLILGMNACLPKEAAVVRARPTRGDFHPRHDARRKRYDYFLMTNTQRRPLLRHRCWFLPHALDEAAVREGLSLMKGRHVFRAFATPRGDETTFERHLFKTSLKHRGNEWHFTFEGDGFLYRMVRRLVGCLVEMGQGKRTADELADALVHSDTSPFYRVAPPQGLTLVNVTYAKKWFLPELTAYTVPASLPSDAVLPSPFRGEGQGEGSV